MSHVERLADRFPELPQAVLLKIDLLRLGARVIDEEMGTRHYHHHDEKGQKPQQDARAHQQGSVRLPEGLHVFIAHNPQSPYLIRHASDGLTLSVDPLMDGHEEAICELQPGPRFQWTRNRTSRGTPLPTLFSPSLGGACGPLAVFLLRHCEFVNEEEECRFCSWVHMGKSHEMRPNALDMREALDAIYAEQRSVGYLAFSGGSLYNRTKEADAFMMYMDAVRETGPRLPATVAAIQALDREDSLRLRQAGFDYACYSMEVWEQACWEAVLPGKNRSVGRQRWMECLTEAVDVFGSGKVLCNFVAGVETAVPGVFSSAGAAADSTVEGFRWCCEHGIYPKYAVWIVSGGARFSDRTPAPLEYYARLTLARQAMYAEYDLPVPDTDCEQCLTQSCEADLARLDPARFATGAAAAFLQDSRHHPAAVSA